jgi:adenylyltransferase/sulfurtransferase
MDKIALNQAKILIIGLGGLGSPVAMYLAAAGVGHLILADFDHVDLSNLQRQIVHDTQQIGQKKTLSAQKKLQALNPRVQISVLNQILEGKFLEKQLRQVDVVVDASDNFTTRFAINAASVHTATPLVSGAALRWGGQVAVFLPAKKNSPCYHCLYDNNEEAVETCSQQGIIAPLVGIIGSIQAVEVIKLLSGIGKSLSGKLLIFEAYTGKWRSLQLHKDASCPVCS